MLSICSHPLHCMSQYSYFIFGYKRFYTILESTQLSASDLKSKQWYDEFFKCYLFYSQTKSNNCSSKAQFHTDLTSIYHLIVTKSATSYVYVSVFCLNLGIAFILTLSDIVEFIRYKTKANSRSTYLTIVSFFFDETISKSWLFAILITPSYYISIFDYSENCLTFESHADVFALTYVAVTILFPVICLIGLFFCVLMMINPQTRSNVILIVVDAFI